MEYSSTALNYSVVVLANSNNKSNPRKKKKKKNCKRKTKTSLFLSQSLAICCIHTQSLTLISLLPQIFSCVCACM